MYTAVSPLVSIITLNWNTTEVTCDFLESSRKLTYKNYEILVCDMNSAQDPTDVINTNNYPNTKVFRSKENLGFSGGNNWGIQKAKGDYIFIVNNDTVLTPDILENLLTPFFNDTSIGVTCPKIVFYDKPTTIQYAGFNSMNMFTARTTAVGSLQEDDGTYDTPTFTNGAHGCAMMVKREVIEKTGMFPPHFFLYYEEWDWSFRILKHGYKISYEPSAKIYHKESVTVGKKNPIKVYYHTRNRILLMRRNASLGQYVVFISFFLLVTTPKSSLMFALKKEGLHFKNFFKGVFEGLTMAK